MSTSIKVEINEKTLKRLVREYLSETLHTALSDSDIKIEVKSDQNYIGRNGKQQALGLL